MDTNKPRNLTQSSEISLITANVYAVFGKSHPKERRGSTETDLRGRLGEGVHYPEKLKFFPSGKFELCLRGDAQKTRASKGLFPLQKKLQKRADYPHWHFDDKDLCNIFPRFEYYDLDIFYHS